MRTRICVFVVFLLSILRVYAQAPGTGDYAFGTFDHPGVDSINVGNLNVRFTIPIVSRQGRGLPFNYAIQYEGLVWSASSIGNITAWTPDPTWGFTGTLNGTAFAGYLTHSTSYYTCYDRSTGSHSSRAKILRRFIYRDAYGAQHPFDYTHDFGCPADGNETITGTGAATDGSGYSLIGEVQVRTISGHLITPAASATSQGNSDITDLNGNQLTSAAGNSFVDTLGATALTIAGSNPVTFAYPVGKQASGVTSQAASVSYKTYLVRTNFQCSTITEYGTNSVDLVDRITFADGSFYGFTYEDTPSATDGAVTGRLKSIMLPTKGIISYAYSGGGCGGSGINPDGTVGMLTRTTSDGTRTYTTSPFASSLRNTLVQDASQRYTAYSFSTEPTTHELLETRRVAYQDTVGSPVLQERTTCYNGYTSSSGCDGQSITLPITRTYVEETMGSGTVAATQTDFTNGFPGAILRFEGSSLITGEAIRYNEYGSVSYDRLQSVDGSEISKVTYGFDETPVASTSGLPNHIPVTASRGNQTSQTVSTGTSTIMSTTAYSDAGMPLSTSANITSGSPSGYTTTYTYDPTQTFITGTTYPATPGGATLSTSAFYDAPSASLSAMSGLNASETTTVNQYDALMRPVNVTTPSGSTLVRLDNGPKYSATTQTLDSTRTAKSEVLLDDYGRISRTTTYNGQTGNNYYQTDSCYDVDGRLQFQSTRYQSSGLKDAGGNDTPKHCSGSGTSYQYDTLGRVTSMTNDDGTSSIVYQGRAVKTVDVNGVGRIRQYDTLGRLIGVCELSSTALGNEVPSPCGMDITGVGYVIGYQYDLGNHKVTTSQGSQIREFITDEAGRTISATEPERGKTTYGYLYNAQGLVVTRKRPRANQPDPTVLTTTTEHYDSLGRLTSTAYDDGLTPNKAYFYDVAEPSLGWTATPQNSFGRLTGTTVGTGTTHAIQQFSYDLAGNITTLWQCAPSICGPHQETKRQPQQFTYDFAGTLTSTSDPIAGYIQYDRSVAEELVSVTSASPQDAFNPGALMSGGVNGPFGPSSFTLGNGLKTVRSYDTLGRNKGQYICNGSSAASCAGGTELYGSEQSWHGARETGFCDTVMAQCQTNLYDEFNRMVGVRDETHIPGGPGSYTYQYDRWGNRVQQTSQSGGPSPQYQFDGHNHIVGLSYDAAGNLENDGISHSFVYDAEGKVLQVDGGSTAQYVYDALGQRVGVQTASTAVEYLYDAFGRQSSSWLVANNLGNAGRVYSDTAQIAYRSPSGLTYFEHQDWEGTERLRTNYLGNAAATEYSLAYGDNYVQAVTIPGGDKDANQFTSHDWDAESGTDHFLFRQYEPAQGRWMSPDPYDGSYDLTNPQSLNRYTYAVSNPYTYLDPLGLTILCTTTTYYVDGQVDSVETNCIDDGSIGGGGTVPYGGGGGAGGLPTSDLTPPNPCLFQGNAMSPAQYAGSGDAAAALGLGAFLGISAIGFPRRSFLDAQPKASGNVFQRAAYGNYAFGVYMASAGVPYAATMAIANAFAMFSHYGAKNGPMDSTYTNLPNANVVNITKGFNAVRNGTPCHR